MLRPFSKSLTAKRKVTPPVEVPAVQAADAVPATQTEEVPAPKRRGRPPKTD